MTPSGRDAARESPAGRAVRWKPRTQVGVWVVAAACGAICFAGQSVHPEWSLGTRAVLAAALAAVAGVSGSMRLRRRLDDLHWSASHPISLTKSAQAMTPNSE